jgi:hypothetical protein
MDDMPARLTPDERVRDWNSRYPVGKWVRVLQPDGVKRITKTSRPAFAALIGGSLVAGVWVEGTKDRESSFVALDRVTPLDTVRGEQERAK